MGIKKDYGCRTSNLVAMFTDKLVYQYLVENGSFETAKELKKIRRECIKDPIDLKGEMTITEFFQGMVDDYWKTQISPNSVPPKKITDPVKRQTSETNQDQWINRNANSIVINFLKFHPKPG